MPLPRFRSLLRASLLLAAAAAIAGCTEGRDAFAITDTGSLIRFQTDDPGKLESELTITGLAEGESVLQIDFSIEPEILYGLTSANRIVSLNPDSGAATYIGSTPFTTDVLMQPVMDYNPANDFLRVIDYDPTGGNGSAILRVSRETGALLQTDGNGVLRFTDSDSNDGEIPQLAAIAHSNGNSRATTTTQYGIDFTTQSLVRITNAGVLSTVGVLDRSFLLSAGFDIVRKRGDRADDLGIAYIAFSNNRDPARLFEIDLADGNTSRSSSGTNGAEIGDNRQIRSLAVRPTPPKREGFNL
ncbi:MAG: DUF4394 domain-containing protein [Nevskia sp.]|uniref:DUF4394 domain-containing protein n=1 Tax=Nevskia sp. TaxID=1929292 RepID=UPI0040360445